MTLYAALFMALRLLALPPLPRELPDFAPGAPLFDLLLHAVALARFHECDDLLEHGQRVVKGIVGCCVLRATGRRWIAGGGNVIRRLIVLGRSVGVVDRGG